MASLSTLTDDFSASNTAKWDYAASTATVTGGQLVTTGGSPSAASTFTDVGYDLTGASCHIEMVRAFNAGLGASATTFTLTQNGLFGDNAFYMWLNNGTLYFYDNIAGAETEAHVTYDSTTHRWWRMRETGGTIYWDTSPNGLTWTNQRNKSVGITITGLFVGFGAYANGVGAPGSMIIDNLNITPPAVASTGAFFAAF